MWPIKRKHNWGEVAKHWRPCIYSCRGFTWTSPPDLFDKNSKVLERALNAKAFAHTHLLSTKSTSKQHANHWIWSQWMGFENANIKRRMTGIWRMTAQHSTKQARLSAVQFIKGTGQIREKMGLCSSMRMQSRTDWFRWDLSLYRKGRRGGTKD